ncbi:unnamed protein product [Blepharisma stoltei]|uniref:Uncharacterized protein n=1 Tax=Blepharisma stoltei TaxID=1481888 RepID=A0AAU9J6W6_9CILI|nr:unnamed protein product [Blepharisma stoltei]
MGYYNNKIMYSFCGNGWEEGVQRLFSIEYDDGNGKISVSELEKFMVKIYHFPYSVDNIKTRIISKIINVINEFLVDADGKVDFEIFKRVYAYKRLDKHGYGWIGLQSFLEIVGPKGWTDEMVTSWFRRYGEVSTTGSPKFRTSYWKFFVNPINK